MNQILIFVLAVFSATFSLAQKPKTIFLNAELESTQREFASYYQVNFVIQDSIKHGPSITNYMTSEKYIDGVYSNNLEEGEFKYYYKNGKPMKVETYNSGLLEGEYHSWYPNGNKKEESYRENNQARVKSFWDVSGVPQVIEGSGSYQTYYNDTKIKEEGLITNYEKDSTWTGYYENGKRHYEEHYLSGILESGTSYDKIDSVYYYYKLNEAVDVEEISAEIKKRMSYLTNNNDRNVAGNLVVSFTLNSHGKITNTEILRTLVGDYNKKVLKTMRIISKKQFEPARFRGQPLDTELTISVNFQSN
jgi:antitoxin component YwqK of YwqJK toxin-antitoxin module